MLDGLTAWCRDENRGSALQAEMWVHSSAASGTIDCALANEKMAGCSVG